LHREEEEKIGKVEFEKLKQHSKSTDIEWRGFGRAEVKLDGLLL
jgi:hypothetical protein